MDMNHRPENRHGHARLPAATHPRATESPEGFERMNRKSALESEIVHFSISVAISLIAVALKMIYEYYYSGSSIDIAEHVMIGLALAFLSKTVLSMLKMGVRFEKSEEFLKEISKSNSDLFDRFSTNENMLRDLSVSHAKILQLREAVVRDVQITREVHENLMKLSDLVRQTGEATFKDYIQKFETEKAGFTVRGVHWSLRSYEIFWEYLVSSQEERANQGDDPLVTRITHSNALDLWSTTEGSHVINLQNKFCKAGGKIVRILMMKNEDKRQEYVEIKKKMERAGVRVYILKITPGQLADLAFDFLWVEPGGHVVKWYSGATGESLDRCSFIDNVDRDTRRQWSSAAGDVLKESENPTNEENFLLDPHPLTNRYGPRSEPEQVILRENI